jgi:arsenate reductase-like glutaredoxin family protein
MYDVILYTLKNCQKSERLKATLNKLGIKFVEKNRNTQEAIAELKNYHCSLLFGPVIRYMSTIYEYYQIFDDDGKVNPQIINAISEKKEKIK